MDFQKRLKSGDLIELTDDVNSVALWFNERTNNFCLELNGEVIKATKTFRPIQKKLDEWDLMEV